MHQRPTVARTRAWLRPLFAAAGLVSVGVGVAGIFLPVVPTVGPLVIAAFLFSRSSPRLHRWLTGHPRLGPLIAAFRKGQGMPLRAKVWTLLAVAASFTASTVWLLTHPAARGAMAVLGVAVMAAVLRIPTAHRA